MKKAVVMTLVTMMLLAGVSLAQTKSGTLQIVGSTTVGPIGDAYAEVFQKKYAELAITVNKTGSSDGAAALIEGRCDIAMMSRFMKPKEFQTAISKDVLPVAHVIALDGVCIIINKANKVNGLTSQQVRDVYLGKINNWKALGGPDMPIVRISRDTSSGTFDTFNHYIMAKQKMTGQVETVNSNPQMHARVSSTEGAIGYVGFGFVDYKVKAIAIDGVAPTKKTIYSGTYLISRPLFLFTNGYPALGSPVHEICTYHLTEEGQQVIVDKGFIPVTDY